MLRKTEKSIKNRSNQNYCDNYQGDTFFPIVSHLSLAFNYLL